jgi:hypothetical protein
MVAAVMLAVGAAAAQTPEQVQYIPRDGAAVIVWMAPAGDVTGYNVYQYEPASPGGDLGAGKKVTAEPIKTTSHVVEGLTNGKAYHFKVSAIVGGTESEQAGPQPTHRDPPGGEKVVVVPQAPVKVGGIDGFVGHTIGTDFPGSHTVAADGSITMKASGWDIWEASDGFYFLATPMSGDLTITARVVSGPTETSDGNGWNLGGVMIRESLDARSRFAMMQVARDNELQFKKRVEFNETPQNDGFSRDDNTARPVTVRLERKGNDFRAWYSDDGTAFEEVGGGVTIDNFAPEPYVGIALSAHQDTEFSELKVDNVTITKP